MILIILSIHSEYIHLQFSYPNPGTNDSITLEDLVDDFATFYVAGKL